MTKKPYANGPFPNSHFPYRKWEFGNGSLAYGFYQNKYFNASCIIRGSSAATDLPNVWLFRFALGFIGLTWFGALNASTRNSNDCPSVTWNLRVKPRSKLISPGPLN